jgi:long-chain acyl-CoA synthetase
LSQFYPKFQSIRDKLHIRALIITGIEDALSGPMKLGYLATQGRKIAPVPKDDSLVLFWKDFLRGGEHYTASFAVTRKGSDTAAILYSGGTTGTTKGILLSNLNFNALGLQTGAAGDCLKAGHKMLSIMPIFHGFGLGVCIHTVLIHSATCILVPQFTVESYAALLKKHKPNYIAGVPTLYEALLRLKKAEKLDLSQLEGIFSGGDSLSIELKHKVDAFLQAHGSKEQIREGYGTTECVTASCLTPKNAYHEGSIGIPFPDTYYKIVTPATHDEVPYGTVGEICISGPTVMQGYMNQPKETAQTLQFHEDGLIWLHTGDLGSMDEQGFIYFKQRLKRMIITSGYNVYPSQVENVIDAHEAVLMSTVIGVKDDYRMQRVKAFVVLRPGYKPSAELEASIREHCKKHVAKYAMPREIEFRDALPKTLVGKVAYTVLEREEAEKASAS